MQMLVRYLAAESAPCDKCHVERRIATVISECVILDQIGCSDPHLFPPANVDLASAQLTRGIGFVMPEISTRLLTNPE